MKRLLLILLSFPMILFGQACDYESSTDASEVCEFVRGNSFATDRNAEKALEMILDATGSTQRFAIKECSNISNCVATNWNDINYILYDKEFMDEIATKANSWSKISILAHEIGHHVYGHTLVNPTSLSHSRQMELEADQYSGFVMFKLGVKLSQAQEAVRVYTSNKDDTYSTHPSKNKRLNAIYTGWMKAKESNNDYATSKFTAEDYFYKGFNSKDPTIQIYNYTKCLSIDPKFNVSAYTNRAFAYTNSGDYDKAIADYWISIEIHPTIYAYQMIGFVYDKYLENKEEAIMNYTRAIFHYKMKGLTEDDDLPNLEASYRNRGIVYAVKDNNYTQAIDDFNEALKIKPNEPILYELRGRVKEYLNQNPCSDYKRGCDLGRKSCCEFHYSDCRGLSFE